jgi:MoxR-like ATPase
VIIVHEEIKKLNEKSKQYCEKLNKVSDEIKKIIVGQEPVIDKLMISLVARGHVLIEGVPGLAKTLMIKSLSETLSVDFSRIQFTPDLLPADIIGTRIFNMKTNTFSTKKGPIFANFILADEINRAPPKCQSALLEAMQEKQVTIGEDTFKLDEPFFVMATQNPLEHEGVYNLPEAQVDRFMFKILISYPNVKEEILILDRMTEGKEIKLSKIIEKKDLLEIQRFCQTIYADEKIKKYAAMIVDATRKSKEIGVDGLIECGASPRATIWLILGGKANAMLNGRGYVIPEDIKEVAYEVLRHRIILSYEAEAENVTSDDVIKKILGKVEVP